MMFDSFGNFVPLYFSLNFAFLLARKLCFFSNFWKLLYKLHTFSVVIWTKERKHKFFNRFYDLATSHLYFCKFILRYIRLILIELLDQTS